MASLAVKKLQDFAHVGLMERLDDSITAIAVSCLCCMSHVSESCGVMNEYILLSSDVVIIAIMSIK